MNGFAHTALDEQQQSWHQHLFPYRLADYEKTLLCKPTCIASIDFQAAATATATATTADEDTTRCSSSVTNDGEVANAIREGKGKGKGKGKGEEHAKRGSAAGVLTGCTEVPMLRSGRCDCVAIWVDYLLPGTAHPSHSPSHSHSPHSSGSTGQSPFVNTEQLHSEPITNSSTYYAATPPTCGAGAAGAESNLASDFVADPDLPHELWLRSLQDADFPPHLTTSIKFFPQSVLVSEGQHSLSMKTGFEFGDTDFTYSFEVCGDGQKPQEQKQEQQEQEQVLSTSDEVSTDGTPAAVAVAAVAAAKRRKM